jgi:multidrug efflux pump subunit AcrA (membrane-fusion protein)
MPPPISISQNPSTERGQNVPANAVLVRIDNPETVAKLEQMKAAKAVADAQLANVLVGTRAETILVITADATGRIRVFIELPVYESENNRTRR